MRRYPGRLGALAVLAAVVVASGCSGGNVSSSSSGAIVPAQAQVERPSEVRVAVTPTVPPWNGQTLSTKYGYYDKNHVYHNPIINGTDMLFTPPVADTPTGGHGPAGSSLDGVNCEVSMSRNYHIHVFVGLYVNGSEYAIPRGTGVAEPLNPNDLSINYATMCFYLTHTHDSTGIVHIESDNNGIVDKPPLDSKFVISQWFAVWGITVNTTQFGQWTGPLEVFTSGQFYRKLPMGGGVFKESLLKPWTGDPAAIPLYDHEMIWYLVGPNYPTGLPNINFADGY